MFRLALWRALTSEIQELTVCCITPNFCARCASVHLHSGSNPNNRVERTFIFFDRIDRIIWILLLLSPLPDEGEKKQSRLKAGNERLGCLHCLVSGSIALSFPMILNGCSLGEGLRFLPFFWKGKKILIILQILSQKRDMYLCGITYVVMYSYSLMVAGFHVSMRKAPFYHARPPPARHRSRSGAGRRVGFAAGECRAGIELSKSRGYLVK